MDLDETSKIKVIENLQKFSKKSYSAVLLQLKIGMSEVEIEELFKAEFRKRGITEYWYSVPINVLIGVERFKIGTTTTDYAIKNPSKNSFLKKGDPVYIDLSPMDSVSKLWGDWSSTFVFDPRVGVDDEQLAFLEKMRTIQRQLISTITARTTGRDIVNDFLKIFRANDITLLDVRNNVGHSLHEGPKDKAQRVWLDLENTQSLGEGFFAVEPGGIKHKSKGNGFVVGRFEEAIYIPKKGKVIILGEIS